MKNFKKKTKQTIVYDKRNIFLYILEYSKTVSLRGVQKPLPARNRPINTVAAIMLMHRPRPRYCASRDAIGNVNEPHRPLSVHDSPVMAVDVV